MSTESGRPSPTERGMSMFVGTVDAKGVPACCRAVGVLSNDDLATVTVYVPMATSRDVIANVAATKRLAVTTCFPLTHLSVQVKGIATAVRLATDGEEPFIRDRVDAYAEVLQKIGVPMSLTRSINHWPAFAIDMKVEETYDQTPGPKAGSVLR